MTNTLRSFADGDVMRVPDAKVTVEVEGVTFEFQAELVEFLRSYDEVPFNISLDSIDSRGAQRFMDTIMPHCTFTVLAGGIRGVVVLRDGETEESRFLQFAKAEQARKVHEFLSGARTRAGAIEL